MLSKSRLRQKNGFLIKKKHVKKLLLSPCFLLRYVLPTSTRLALSSLIINSEFVKGLPDFIIANAFGNTTGKCFLLLEESNFFAWSASDSPPVLSFVILLNASFALWWKWSDCLQWICRFPTRNEKQPYTNGLL